MLQGESWMCDNLGLLGGRTLRKLCIPGSHDSGMSTFDGHTAGATLANTQTQSRGILGQLMSGTRYFDIRPVQSRGKFKTGHYSEINVPIFGRTWQGANGQSVTSIINDINNFTLTYKELVVMRLSHDLNTDLDNNAYRPLTRDEWNQLVSELAAIDCLYVADDPASVNLSQLTLADYIGAGRAAVIVAADTDAANLGDHARKGFYTYDRFRVYDQYSNTNDVGKMISDQIGKMRQQRPSPDSPCFLLSWTLTQQGAQVIRGPSILEMAQEANAKLYESLLPACTPSCFPNVIYVDNITSPGIADLAMAVNRMSGST